MEQLTTDSDPNPTTGNSNPVTVTSGGSNQTIDAGLYQPASLGNYVWEDANKEWYSRSWRARSKWCNSIVEECRRNCITNYSDYNECRNSRILPIYKS
jgi:hypothetical protein